MSQIKREDQESGELFDSDEMFSLSQPPELASAIKQEASSANSEPMEVDPSAGSKKTDRNANPGAEALKREPSAAAAVAAAGDEATVELPPGFAVKEKKEVPSVILDLMAKCVGQYVIVEDHKFNMYRGILQDLDRRMNMTLSEVEVFKSGIAATAGNNGDPVKTETKFSVFLRGTSVAWFQVPTAMRKDKILDEHQKEEELRFGQGSGRIGSGLNGGAGRGRGRGRGGQQQQQRGGGARGPRGRGQWRPSSPTPSSSSGGGGRKSGGSGKFRIGTF